MTDGRDFTWSAKAQDKVCDLIEEGLYGDRPRDSTQYTLSATYVTSHGE